MLFQTVSAISIHWSDDTEDDRTKGILWSKAFYHLLTAAKQKKQIPWRCFVVLLLFGAKRKPLTASSPFSSSCWNRKLLSLGLRATSDSVSPGKSVLWSCLGVSRLYWGIINLLIQLNKGSTVTNNNIIYNLSNQMSGVFCTYLNSFQV